ncbi:hypothetical protein DYB25_002089 [Aphanomyces astaci]|uniref:DDRGK domain-containing protein 1 n=1 Tax=Aphanomyces astaci TaxID=112090 RepID=A0A397ATH3_APHAT|nr:hypothetical protein DYB25_002089 [Aphanomyces astaci]RHY67248.1 hypothetical protein DYB38_000038 [Aphanomyces astaci]RHZ16535.1 hypothetical protein DYB31_001521 [Aphanomyces astaci]
MNTDVILLIIAVAGLLVTFATTLYLVGYFRSASSSSVEEKDPRQAVAGGVPRNNNRGGLRALRHRRQGAAVVNENAEHRAQAVEVHDGADNDVEEATRYIPSICHLHRHVDNIIVDRVVGTSRKAMQKELKRQEREQLRKAHRKRMEAADADDAAREADLEAMRLRQEAEDQVEFDKWRALISVEDAGTDADVVDSHKVVVLEDVAAEFGLRTEDARDRVAALVASGRLSGLLDDRGKFVSISDHEMNAVATYIRTQGRLTLHDLGRECNRLVRFD